MVARLVQPPHIADAFDCASFGARAILPNERLFDLTIRVVEVNDAAALAS